MKNILLNSICVMCLSFIGTATAQVANGDFEQGEASWTYKSVTIESLDLTLCSDLDAPYVESSGLLTPPLGTPPASGKVGYIAGKATSAAGNWRECTRIEQAVFIPLNKQLKFDYRIGDKNTNPYAHYADTIVRVYLYDSATGDISDDFSATGRSTSMEPSFVSGAASTAGFGGRYGTLIIETASSVSNHGADHTYPSPAYIDNVRFE